MKTTLFMALIALPLFFLTIGGVVYLFILLCRALKKYISSSDFRKESAIIKKSLGEVLKNHRTKNKMTQEFVAEAVGVSRQSVSKWEQGVSALLTYSLWQNYSVFLSKNY